MIAAHEWLLVGSVAAVGVLHTIVPDHWVPITLIARQQRWNTREVARAALIAGTGHTVSTLLIGLAVWIAGVAFAAKFGNLVSTVSSIALIAFGSWIAIASLRELRDGSGHGHNHAHVHDRDHDDGTSGLHGPQRDRPDTRTHRRPFRTTLLLIVGSSPMVEGLPAFFAAGKFGAGLIIIMALVFAASTIATYIMVCLTSVAGLQRLSFGPLEQLGEVLSGAFIALVGLVFFVFPVL